MLVASRYLIGVIALAFSATVAAAATVDIPIVPDGIGGVVTSTKGPEAGVWVIAETKDLPTPYIKIVVTDDQGCYVLPDLPSAKYLVWVRGYGLTDSTPVSAKPGAKLDLTATIAATPAEAAQIYPANYWLSLLHPPGDNNFPGTGRAGNGFAPTLKSANDWLVEMKEGCLPCHQLGTFTTRTMPATPTSSDAWDQRVQRARSENDVLLGGSATMTGAAMSATMSHLGRPGSLKIFSDWTDRIAKGEVPESPPRPSGIERNVVLTIADWGMGEFVHSTASTDRRNPTVNANGLIYGGNTYHGNLITYDPVKHVARNIPVPKSQPPRQRDAAPMAHNPALDGQGRVWVSEIPSATGKPEPSYCSDGKLSPFAAFYPIEGEQHGHEVIEYDPAAKKFELFDYCVNSQIPVFLHDKDNTVAFSGMNSVISWIDTKVWDETHDAAKSIGWCPIVVDSNGDGKIEPDRSQWNVPASGGNDGSQNAMGEGAQATLTHGVPGFDPKRDTQISGYWYGVGVDPQDDSIWAVKFTPFRQSGIVRLERGAHPPETCKGEYYEPPKRTDGLYAAYNARGVELDSKGVAWVAFGSGQIGRFDRSKCKALNGPAAGTGQGCPEGWTILDPPGPKLGKVGTADWYYMAWVDLYNASGLGQDVPLITGTISDSIKAVLPGNKIVSLTVPYPQSFYTRYLDARIDDPNAGWKGRGIWAAYAQVPQWHIEGGEGTTSKIVHFQVRPDPLAH
jgi:hypothetical protein